MEYEDCIYHCCVPVNDEVYEWCGLFDYTCLAAHGYRCDNMEGEE